MLAAEAYLQLTRASQGLAFNPDPVLLHYLRLPSNTIWRAITAFEGSDWVEEHLDETREMIDCDDDLLVSGCHAAVVDSFALGLIAGLRLAVGDKLDEVEAYIASDADAEGLSRVWPQRVGPDRTWREALEGQP